ncbi:MAG: hypothetical protein DMG96_24315 [Acidobacteria bacterium]|nr:MAG: hypothetical protein DMG96_24315 [Acidobacteriota bacterium]
MKLLISIFLLAIALPAFPQSAQKPSLPRYNPAAEAVYTGAVLDVRDRECPVSGGIGTHILMKLENGNTIEVHLATTEFTKVMEMNLQKGDPIEVIGKQSSRVCKRFLRAKLNMEMILMCFAPKMACQLGFTSLRLTLQ